MNDESPTILTRINLGGQSGELETLDVEEPYGVMKDFTYTGDYYLVRWPVKGEEP